MNNIGTKFNPAMSAEELGLIGKDALSYIREVQGSDLNRIIGAHQVAPEARLFCLFNANGAPISVSGTREAACDFAAEHDLLEIRLN